MAATIAPITGVSFYLPRTGTGYPAASCLAFDELLAVSID